MKNLLLFTLFSFLILGCSDKNYFEPKDIAGEIEFDREISSELIDSNRNGGTLKSGLTLTERADLGIKLPNRFLFLNESKEFILAANSCGDLKIFDKTSKELYSEMSFEYQVISASISGNLLAVILSNNRASLFDLESKEQLFSQKNEAILAIDSKVASPQFLSGLILFPTLDGKVIVVDADSYQFIRDIVVSSEKFFNNVIFLEVLDNRLIAVTPKKAVSVNPNYTNTLDVESRDILLLDENLYFLTKDGQVILANLDLNILKTRKYPFAHFVGVINGKYIYAVEKQGYLIAFDKNLITSNVFQLSEEIDGAIFTKNDKIFYKNRLFRLQN